MKKKILLIFFIVLIVIFLIFFINKKDNINELVNNTIENTDEYKITLTLKNIYYIENKKINNKIVYVEQKKNDKYKFINKIFDNDTLINESINYLDGNKYYYKEKNSYKEKIIDDVKNVKNFNINYTDFFKKIKNMRISKTIDDKIYYKSKMKSEDAFSLIYDNSKNDNLEEYTYVTIVASNNDIEEVYFNVKDKENSYYVNLKMDFGLQELNLDIK